MSSRYTLLFVNATIGFSENLFLVLNVQFCTDKMKCDYIWPLTVKHFETSIGWGTAKIDYNVYP